MWYRFYCHSGPGHQSMWEQYHWFETPLSEEEKEQLWEEFFYERDYPIGGVEEIEELPEKERKLQVMKYRAMLESAEMMLEVLGDE